MEWNINLSISFSLSLKQVQTCGCKSRKEFQYSKNNQTGKDYPITVDNLKKLWTNIQSRKKEHETTCCAVHW